MYPNYIICKRAITAIFGENHSITSAVCDDSMDVQCVAPSPGCYIHKHQLCDNITDCEEGSDEKSALCFQITAHECKRKFHYQTLLLLPNVWIVDGIEDCVGGFDEDILYMGTL